MTTPGQRFQGLVYRAHHPRWAYAPLSGGGARRHGGRFNRPGCSALYTSLDPTTAWLEAQQGLPFKAQPMTLVAYRVDCADIVDLTEPGTRHAEGISTSDLACPWEGLASRAVVPPTWLLADRLLAAGVAGIRVRSYAPGCVESSHKLVLWQWGKEPPHGIQVVDDPQTPESYAALPRSTKSAWISPNGTASF